MSAFEDFLNTSIIQGFRVDSIFVRCVLDVIAEHSVIDIVLRTGWPRINFHLHQPGRHVIGKSCISRSIQLSFDQLYAQKDRLANG